MHWADVIASRLEEKGSSHRIATGITPSGHIHVGNMREILTGDLIHRACQDRGLDSELIYFADDFDPLRKVYPFLPDNFSDHVGRPLSEIPSPDGEGSYSEFFLKPFLESLRKLGVDPTVERSSISYREGKYYPAAKKILDDRARVKDILERISKRNLPDEWMPYNPRCSACGSISDTGALFWEDPFVGYRCNCGHEGKADTRTDDGKLPWRVDWPARWYWRDVTCEPFGKDHAAAGGSFDTSSEIIRAIFEREPPEPLVYEWIQLKGKGAMSSSTGVVVSAVDMLRMTPPEVLRFLIAKNRPSRHVEMDPGLGILNLVDEFDRCEAYYLENSNSEGDPDDKKRTYELSLANRAINGVDIPAVNVPYRHLVTLTQLVDSIEDLVAKIRRSEGVDEIDERSMERLERRADRVRFWLDNFAPEMVKFELFDETPVEKVRELSEQQVRALEVMRDAFSRIDWSAEAIHNAVYESSRANGISPKQTFKAFYRILLGRDRGPRLGFFLSTMDRQDVLRRIDRVRELISEGFSPN